MTPSFLLPAAARARTVTRVRPLLPDAGPRVSSLQPTKGPQAGGTRVTVVGTGFKTGTTKCQFGILSPASAMYISQTQVVCISPPGSAASSGSVSVEVTTDNSGAADTFSADGVLFTYQGVKFMPPLQYAAGSPCCPVIVCTLTCVRSAQRRTLYRSCSRLLDHSWEAHG